ncbi:hypothetical protein OSTOST_01142 [Ostertagia ostertagi]
MGGHGRHALTVQAGDEVLQLYAYKIDRWKTVIYYALTICTLGIFRLILHWRQDWYIKARASRCSHDVADYVNVIDEHNVEAFRPIRLHMAVDGISPVLPTVIISTGLYPKLFALLLESQPFQLLFRNNTTNKNNAIR